MIFRGRQPNERCAIYVWVNANGNETQLAHIVEARFSKAGPRIAC